MLIKKNSIKLTSDKISSQSWNTFLFSRCFFNFSFFKKTPKLLRNRNYNFYEVLGIERSCSNEQIREAYLKLAKQYHPDINKDPGSDDKFKSITVAYEALSNQRNRDLYDAYMNSDPYSQEWKYKEEHYREDRKDSERDFYRERARYDTYSKKQYQHQAESNFWQGRKEDFEGQFYKEYDNIFNSNPYSSRKPTEQKGSDIMLEISITIKEAYKGVDKGVTFTRKDKCKSCHGMRSSPGHRPSKCFSCNGTGELKTSMFNSKKCGQCKGSGYIIKNPCKYLFNFSQFNFF
jgi:molecular chaperone DnaJ